MAKSTRLNKMKKGNINQFDEQNERKRNKSTELIKNAVDYLLSIGDVLSINNVSKETIRLDPDKKGLSVHAFRNKKLTHIQSLMKEYKIGKYSGLIISEIDNKPDINHMLKINKENEELIDRNRKLVKLGYLLTIEDKKKIIESYVSQNKEINEHSFKSFLEEYQLLDFIRDFRNIIFQFKYIQGNKYAW